MTDQTDWYCWNNGYRLVHSATDSNLQSMAASLHLKSEVTGNQCKASSQHKDGRPHPVLMAVEMVNSFGHCLDRPSRRPSGRVMCRGDHKSEISPEKALSCNAFSIDGPSRQAMCRGNSWRAVKTISWHAKHHLKFTNIFRSRFANQPHGESKRWSSADGRFFSRQLRCYDDSASPARCGVKLTQEDVFFWRSYLVS